MSRRKCPDPQPKPGEVVIRVKAVGVNFADLLQRMGVYPGTPKPPFVPGLEIAGVVEKVAEGGKASGRRAVARGRCRGGAYHVQRLRGMGGGAGRTRVSPAGWHAVRRRRGDSRELPHRVSLDVRHGKSAARRPDPDSRRGRRRGNCRGAIGASARGLEIYGTAGPTKQEYLRKIGVDHAIDYEKSDFVDVVRKFAPDGIEMVMDPIGGKSFAQSHKCLGPTGRLVVYGFSAAAGADGKKSAVARPGSAARRRRDFIR